MNTIPIIHEITISDPVVRFVTSAGEKYEKPRIRSLDAGAPCAAGTRKHAVQAVKVGGILYIKADDLATILSQ